MHFSLPRCSGKADPLGLLVLAVMLAFAVTIGVQAQAGLDAADARTAACEAPCMIADMHH